MKSVLLEIKQEGIVMNPTIIFSPLRKEEKYSDFTFNNR